jgi:serine-type D-Ala-D-Ala carboxypeptidase (penicillin-binding protein 5/6)
VTNKIHVKSKLAVLILCLTLIVHSITLVSFPMKGQAATPIDLGLQVKAAILIEATTGQVLYELNADEALPPASMSKMMTEFLVMEAISSGKIGWEDQVTVSQYANDVIGSGQLIATGEKYSVRDLFGAMSIYSANDASVALAEFVGGGTEENFVNQMNEAAKRLGMSKSHFINATGLSRADLGKYSPSIPGETLMSARDAATLARAIVNGHPEVLDFSKTPAKKFREKDASPMINWNWMLEGNKDNVNFRRYAYTGLDGLKTGHTKEAGYCFTGTAVRNGMRLISVVMAAESEPQRFLQTAKIMDYGFNTFEIKTVLPPKTEIESLKTVTIKKGIQTEVPVVTQEGVQYVVRKAEQANITTEAAALDESKRIAPIKQGDVLGTVKVTYDGIVKEVNLVATEDVEKGSWVRLFFRAIKNFFGDIFSGIAGGIKNLF